MQPKDQQDIQRANKQACVYYCFICQFMLTYMIYSILKIVFILKGEKTDEDVTTEKRMFDILTIVISLSNMIMLYGVSDSIKKSIDRQIRTDRIVSTLDDFISDVTSSSESHSDEDQSLNEYLGTG